MAIRAVALELNGSEHLLRLDLGAMAALEDRGVSIESLMDKLGGGNFSPKSMGLILWAMLQGEDEAPSLKQVGTWVDGENFGYVAEKIGETLRLAFPEKVDKSQDPPKGAGTGARPSALQPAHSP